MKTGDRVQTLTGRHGIIQAIDSVFGRVVARLRIEGDIEADGELEIPLGCLVPSPLARPEPSAGGQEKKT